MEGRYGIPTYEEIRIREDLEEESEEAWEAYLEEVNQWVFVTIEEV